MSEKWGGGAGWRWRWQRQPARTSRNRIWGLLHRPGWWGRLSCSWVCLLFSGLGHNYNDLTFHSLAEEDQGENSVGEDSKAEDHVVKHKEAALIGEVGHEGLEVGVGVNEVVLDGIEEYRGGCYDVDGSNWWHTYIIWSLNIDRGRLGVLRIGWSALALAPWLLLSANLDGCLLGRRHHSFAIPICVYEVGVPYFYTCVFLHL